MRPRQTEVSTPNGWCVSTLAVVYACELSRERRQKSPWLISSLLPRNAPHVRSLDVTGESKPAQSPNAAHANNTQVHSLPTSPPKRRSIGPLLAQYAYITTSRVCDSCPGSNTRC
jgi:hypothetical protein